MKKIINNSNAKQQPTSQEHPQAGWSFRPRRSVNSPLIPTQRPAIIPPKRRLVEVKGLWPAPKKTGRAHVPQHWRLEGSVRGGWLLLCCCVCVDCGERKIRVRGRIYDVCDVGLRTKLLESCTISHGAQHGCQVSHVKSRYKVSGR